MNAIYAEYSTKESQPAPEVRSYRNHEEMMALVTQVQIERGLCTAGMIVHKSTVPRARYLNPINNIKIRQPPITPNASKPIPKNPIVDAEYDASEIEAHEAKKVLNALSDLGLVRIRTESGKWTSERSDRAGKTPQEKRKMRRDEARLKEKINHFRELKRERQEAQRKPETAAKRAPSQTSANKKRISAPSASRLPKYP